MQRSTGRTSSNGRASSNGNARTSSKSSNSRSGSKTAGASRTSSRGNASSSGQEDLEKVMKSTLKDLYYAEKQLFKALGKMSKNAQNEELKEAFDTHREETEGQIEKLEQVFEMLGTRAAGKKCPAMDGLIEEGVEAIEEYDKGPARDAALIVAAQKAEHYEISAYGSLRAFANVLGYTDCEQIFTDIRDQESETDEKLTQIAATINEQAAAESEEEDEEEMEEA